MHIKLIRKLMSVRNDSRGQRPFRGHVDVFFLFTVHSTTRTYDISHHIINARHFAKAAPTKARRSYRRKAGDLWEDDEEFEAEVDPKEGVGSGRPERTERHQRRETAVKTGAASWVALKEDILKAAELWKGHPTWPSLEDVSSRRDAEDRNQDCTGGGEGRPHPSTDLSIRATVHVPRECARSATISSRTSPRSTASRRASNRGSAFNDGRQADLAFFNPPESPRHPLVARSRV